MYDNFIDKKSENYFKKWNNTKHIEKNLLCIDKITSDPVQKDHIISMPLRTFYLGFRKQIHFVRYLKFASNKYTLKEKYLKTKLFLKKDNLYYDYSR